MYKSKHLLFCVVGVLIYTISVTGEFPPEVERCKFADKKCIMKSLNYILKNLYKGDPDVAMGSIDPLDVGELDILNKGIKSAVDIDLKFKNSKVYGFKDSRPVKLSGFGKTPEGHHEVILKIPKLSIIGDYKINGKVLILPIVGNGLANITFSKVDFKIKIDGAAKAKNGETHFDITKLGLDANVGRMYVNFTQLFNGNKDLSDTMNKFINENWEEIYNEIKRSILNAFAIKIRSFLIGVFEFTPYNRILNTT